MADFLIALGLAVLLGVGVVVYQRWGGGPAERRRARAIADAFTPLPALRTDEEREHVEEIHALYEECTDEFPTLAFHADPLGAPIPDGHRVEDETFFHTIAADRLSAFTWAATRRETVPLASVQVTEPARFELESFTTGWTRADVERMVAEAKAARR